MHAGYKDVFISVVVVVSDGNTRVIACSRKSRLLCDVGKRAVTVVVKEPVPVFRRCLVQRSDVCSIREEDVEIAVVIVVEDGHAPGHGFRGVLLRSLTTIEYEWDRFVGEVNRRGTCAENRFVAQ